MGWLQCVAVSTSTLHTEGPEFVPQVEPQTMPRVSQAPGARHTPGACREYVGDTPPSEIQFLWGNNNIYMSGVEGGGN